MPTAPELDTSQDARGWGPPSWPCVRSPWSVHSHAGPGHSPLELRAHLPFIPGSGPETPQGGHHVDGRAVERSGAFLLH